MPTARESRNRTLLVFTYYINKFYETDNCNAISYFFRDDERIPKQTAGSMEWYLSDHLCNTILLIDESGLLCSLT